MRLINETLVLLHNQDDNEEDEADESDYEVKDKSDEEEIVRVILIEPLLVRYQIFIDTTVIINLTEKLFQLCVQLLK